MTQPDETTKVCPLTNRTCLGQDCALWVRLLKHCDNPLTIKTYRGCGLVATIPWKLEKHSPAKEEMETDSE